MVVAQVIVMRLIDVVGVMFKNMNMRVDTARHQSQPNDQQITCYFFHSRDFTSVVSFIMQIPKKYVCSGGLGMFYLAQRLFDYRPAPPLPFELNVANADGHRR